MEKNKIARTILLIIVIICFGYLIIYYAALKGREGQDGMLSNMTESTSSEGVTNVVYETDPVTKKLIKKSLRVLPKYENLYNKNKNLIGWIKIDDTDIDYPVMKSINQNGEFYLDHDYDGKEDRNGSLFMDDLCNPTRPSDNLIIYGHNMKSGKMFGSLDNYKSKDFCDKHKIILFDTIYRQGKYEVAYAFNSHVFSEAEIAFKYYQFIDPNSEDEFNSGIREMKNMSLYDTGVEVSYGDELLTLSTCDYDESNGRFVVVCKRIED